METIGIPAHETKWLRRLYIAAAISGAVWVPTYIFGLVRMHTAELVCMNHGYPEVRENKNAFFVSDLFCYKMKDGTDMLVPVERVGTQYQ